MKKHKLLVRKILSKLIRKMGVDRVTRLMPEYHRAMITYIEREQRKKTNKKQKEKLIALMGGEGDEAAAVEDEADSESSDESADEGT